MFVVLSSVCCSVKCLLFSQVFVVQSSVCCSVKCLLFSQVFVVQSSVCCSMMCLLSLPKIFNSDNVWIDEGES